MGRGCRAAGAQHPHACVGAAAPTGVPGKRHSSPAPIATTHRAHPPLTPTAHTQPTHPPARPGPGWYVTPRQLKSRALYDLTSGFCYQGDAVNNNNTGCEKTNSAPVRRGVASWRLDGEARAGPLGAGRSVLQLPTR